MPRSPAHRTMRPDAPRLARGVAVMLVLASTSLDAQDSASTRHSDWMVAGTVGMFGAGRESFGTELTSVGVTFTQARPGRLGAEVAVGTVPRLLQYGLPLALRADAVLPLVVAPGVMLLPAAGVSAIGAVGSGGGAVGLVGYNVGAAAAFGTGSVGVRTGVTWHWLQDTRRAIWLLELGVVRLPQRD